MVLRLFSFLRERRIAQNHTRELRLFKRDMIPVLSEFTANHNVNLLYSCQQVLLQTSHIVCPCLWLDHLGVCCNYPGCIGRRPRQTKSVRFFLSKFCQHFFNLIPSGLYAAIASFLTFSMIQFRDGPFIRPHPSFWRIVLGVNLLYELGLVFLLFQDLGTARVMMTFIDPSLGVPLPEKNYAEDCALTVQTIWVCQ